MAFQFYIYGCRFSSELVTNSIRSTFPYVPANALQAVGLSHDACPIDSDARQQMMVLYNSLVEAGRRPAR